LPGIYQGAFFQDNQSLVDWINSQELTDPVFCLGDGHDVIWNIVAEISEKEKRIEILDWYHLMENLHKIQGTKSQIEQLKAYLWFGQVGEAISYLKRTQPLGGNQLSNYLKKHAQRIVNYHYLRKAESLFNW